MRGQGGRKGCKHGGGGGWEHAGCTEFWAATGKLGARTGGGWWGGQLEQREGGAQRGGGGAGGASGVTCEV